MKKIKNLLEALLIIIAALAMPVMFLMGVYMLFFAPM